MNLRKKICYTCIAMVMAGILCIGYIAGYAIKSMRWTVEETSRELGKTTGKISSDSMTEQIKDTLLLNAQANADEADDIFVDLLRNTKIIADEVTYLYEHEDEYSPRSVPLPDINKARRLSVQLLHSESADMTSPELIAEVGLLGNAQDTLKYINLNSANMVYNYIATCSGLIIQADYSPENKFDKNGKIYNFEPSDRGWYVGAMETQDAYFTSVARDIYTEIPGIACGVPFYKGDQCMGVAGASMYLSNIEKAVRENQIMEDGFSCIMNKDGRIIFSSAEEGILKADPDHSVDVRTETEGKTREILIAASEGKQGVDLLETDEGVLYVAYAPMHTVGWSFLTLVKEDKALSPSAKICTEIDETTQEMIDKMDQDIILMMIVIFLAGLLICAVILAISVKLSGYIVMPIQKLTKCVKEIDGDNLEFEWKDNAKDETAILAKAFEDMTHKMKQYISDITKITAEKERIGAELDIAAKIQEDMLPKIFPPFPQRKEFDIYATMEPAKEVGGDFYDFFLIDEDHLGVVIADVSSKGVPAALFMVIAKTLLKNHAMSRETLEDVFYAANNQLCEGNEEGMFVTAWMAVLTISTGELQYINAGHNPQLLAKADGFDWIPAKPGFVLAGIENIPYESSRCQMERGGRLFLYTDGLSEAQNAAGELYGEERLLESINRHRTLPLQEMLRSVRADIDAFVGEAEQFDDMTMVVLEYRGNNREELKLQASDDTLQQVLVIIEKHLQENACDPEVQRLILVAVEEIYVNIAHYAYGGKNGEAIVQMEISQDPRSCRVTFRDKGAPYNPLEKDDPDTTIPLEERQIGGLGIYLVKQTMDHVEYEYKDGYNILTIEKEI